jgi:hypothetical protein
MSHAVDQLAELAAELPLRPLDTRDPTFTSGASHGSAATRARGAGKSNVDRSA